jgi:hypothetical protein
MVPQRPFLQRQARLGSLQGLYLALLVHAKHKRLIRRIQIEADHVGEFLEEFRIARQLERLGAMGLDVVANARCY